MQVLKVLDVFLDDTVHCCSPEQLAHAEDPQLWIPGAYAWESEGKILAAVVKPAGPIRLQGFGLCLDDNKQEVYEVSGLELVPVAAGLIDKDLSRLDQQFMLLIEEFKNVAGMFPATEYENENENLD